MKIAYQKPTISIFHIESLNGLCLNSVSDGMIPIDDDDTDNDEEDFS